MIAILLAFVLGVIIGAGAICCLAITINRRQIKSQAQLKQEAETLSRTTTPEQLGEWLRSGRMPDRRAN